MSLHHPRRGREAEPLARGMRVAVQGFGNVGSFLAKFLHEEGSTVIAISDSTTALYNPKASTCRRRSRTSASTTRSPDEGCRADHERRSAPPRRRHPRAGALEQVITEDNAAKVKAGIICEGANGPVTPGADAILEDNGVLILPDVLANAGGVVVSYFEWVQGSRSTSGRRPR